MDFKTSEKTVLQNGVFLNKYFKNNIPGFPS